MRGAGIFSFFHFCYVINHSIAIDVLMSRFHFRGSYLYVRNMEHNERYRSYGGHVWHWQIDKGHHRDHDKVCRRRTATPYTVYTQSLDEWTQTRSHILYVLQILIFMKKFGWLNWGLVSHQLAKVIWRWDLGLFYSLTDWRSQGSNLRPLYYKAIDMTSTPWRLLREICLFA